MESLAAIRRNIGSIKSTETITKTMKLVASARIKKAQNSILGARPFANKLEQMAAKLAYDLKGDESFKSSGLR
ncbi:MAG TPA: F0F1 ATP synthase subunit gamma [Elusimicrobiales bacterium]|nr:F0F1 ATP synthase subunit gamma [Elusimicrobiales bacterium]